MPDLKLNIYTADGKSVEKTYITNEFRLMFGTVEDLLDAINFDKLNDEREVVRVVVASLKQLRPLLKSVFDGLTDDEIRRTDTRELIPLFVQIVVYSMDEMKGLAGKNLTGA